MALAIPKKTKIFIEQTVRERENATAIHNIFQSELWRMRLEAAKVTVDILKTGDSTFSGDFHTPMKLLALVDGLGPDFLLTVTLENISATKVVTNLSVLLHANPEHYKIEKRYAELTPLMPGMGQLEKRVKGIKIMHEYFSIMFCRDSFGHGLQRFSSVDVRQFVAWRYDVGKLYY